MKASPYFQTEPENEISFNYIPRKYLTSNIRLTNISQHALGFKIKTNVPICYLVKPHVGTVLPNHSVNVAITMQPTDYNPQTASINDKFLINVIPLPEDIDVATLSSDQARFQQVWEAVPKSQVQASKLKVVLKFEASRVQNTSDKSTEDASKISSESKGNITESGLSKTVRLDDTSPNESQNREEQKSPMMMSFGNDVSGVGVAQSHVLAQNSLVTSVNNQTSSQVPTVAKSEEKKKAAPVQVPQEDKSEEGKDSLKELEEKAELLEKRIEELNTEKKNRNQEYQGLVGKSEEQKRALLELSEEINRMKGELENLKSSASKVNYSKKEGKTDPGAFQLWQILLAGVISMFIGRFLSSS